MEPVEHVIGTSQYTSHKGGLKQISQTASYVPLGQMLTNFLSLPGVMTEIKAHMSAEGGDSDSFIKGKLWEETVTKHSDKKGTLIPLMHYYDDFETGNPLGSKASVNKFGGNYTVVMGLPPRFNAVLDNLLVCETFRSSFRNEWSNERVFKSMIYQYKSIARDGLEINGEKVYPLLQFCSGDNLSIHQYLGLVEGFTANYPCRFCKMERKDFDSSFADVPDLYRTVENYNVDVTLADKTVTGEDALKKL